MAFSEADQGKHWMGHVGLADRGNNPAGVVNPQEGALYLYDDGSSPHLYKLMCYHSSAWIVLCTLDHGALADLLDDSHPQYLKLNGGMVPTGDLNMGGQLLMPSTGVAGTKEYGQFLTKGHSAESHPALGNASVVKDGIISGTKLKISTVEYNDTIGAFVSKYIPLSYYGFVPQVLLQNGSNTEDVTLLLYPGGLVLYNNSILTYTYRVRQRYLSV
jgi:hypothetical protein